jgi:uncharacterized protein YbjT (DUF2867 family)
MVKQTVLVFGATGRQGGSVARHLLKDETFDVRLFVRDLKHANAIELKDKGATLFKGDLKDKESIQTAMKDVDYIYAVTDYWDNPRKPELEWECGKNLMDCAKEAKIKHMIFSSLESTKDMTDGRYCVECFDTKAKILKHGKTLGIPLSQICLPFYM